MSTKTPLWKQIAGALGGAAVAVILYEGFLLIPAQLQAYVTLPSFPGMAHQDEAQFGGSVGTGTQLRQASRNREIALHFAASSAASSVRSSSSARRMPAGLQGVVDATNALLTSSSSSHSSVAATSSSSVSSSSVSSATRRASSAARRVQPAAVTRDPEQPIHGRNLPNSGAGDLAVAIAAFGATFTGLRFTKAKRLSSSEESLPS